MSFYDPYDPAKDYLQGAHALEFPARTEKAWKLFESRRRKTEAILFDCAATDRVETLEVFLANYAQAIHDAMLTIPLKVAYSFRISGLTFTQIALIDSVTPPTARSRYLIAASKVQMAYSNLPMQGLDEVIREEMFRGF